MRIIPQKTGIVFQVRVRFAGVRPRKSYLLGAFWFPRRHSHPRFRKIQQFAPRCYIHELRIASEKKLDAEVKRWIREAYAVGEQKHLVRRANPY